MATTDVPPKSIATTSNFLTPGTSGSRTLLVGLILSAVFGSSSAVAAPTKFDRHPPHPPRTLPVGVPAGYVLTHNGFFHPSCVYTLRSDEIVSRDLVIRGLDGTEHERIAACAYPRFSLRGEQVTHAPHTPHPGSATYNGWLLFGWAGVHNQATVPTGSLLTTTWEVPTPPTNVGDQDLAFFNGFELDANGQDLIIQPVLDFSELPNAWAIESESCCVNGNDLQSTLVAVNPGDTIRGTLVPSGCNAQTGVCTSFTVTTVDLTTGGTTTLNADTDSLAVNEVDSAVFETYGITSCDMLPASGEVDFASLLKDGNGNPTALKYVIDNCVNGSCPDGENGVVSAIPTNCGWGVTTPSVGSFHMTFQSSPFDVDGGGVIFDASVSEGDAFIHPIPAVDLGGERDASVPVHPPTEKKQGCAMAPLGATSPRPDWIIVALAGACLLLRRRGAR
jgi:hypothetical protein